MLVSEDSEPSFRKRLRSLFFPSLEQTFGIITHSTLLEYTLCSSATRTREREIAKFLHGKGQGTRVSLHILVSDDVQSDRIHECMCMHVCVYACGWGGRACGYINR